VSAPAVLIALGLTAAQAAPQELSPYNCQVGLGPIGGAVSAWVSMSLDVSNRPVRRDLLMRIEAFLLSWRLDAGPLSAPEAMEPLTYTLELPATTPFPVSVNVSGDGRRLWRGSFAQSAGVVGHYPPLERFSSIRLVWGRGYPISNIFGVRRLDISVRDARGATIRRRISLPDWNMVVRRLGPALLEAERQRQAGSCTLTAIP